MSERRALIDRLGVLYHSVIDHLTPEDPRVIGGGINIDDLGIWLARVRTDPNFDKTIIKEWIEALETHIKHGQMKLEFAKLCGRLYTDWLESGDSVTARSDVSGFLPPETGKENIKQEGRKELHEQVARLRSIIFRSTEVDTAALDVYLNNIFSSKTSAALLDEMRQGMAAFGKDLRDRTITALDMRWTVESLLASDLMLPDKRAALREFTDNETVLAEVANVINMRLRTLGSWKWPAEGIEVDMRRYLHGKYRAFTDPDILDALFLQWAGVMWGMKFKQDARDIFLSNAWKFAIPGSDSSTVISDTIAIDSSINTINAERKRHRNTYFLTGHLPDNVNSRLHYDEPADATGDDLGDTASATVEVKQQLLNIMSMECHLNLSLHGSHTIARTDMDWFGPSLPHEAIITILRFFGIPADWLEFFHAFLRMPVCFPGDPEVRTRVRGTPISYALSAFFGEAVLFGMDFAVNQHAHGVFLYRIHDDIWWWDSNSKRCSLAWQEMNRYAQLVGLRFNEQKSGSICVRGEIDPNFPLPTGDIRWGFLKFDSSEARFVIDQEQVNEHITELRRQLANTKSVLGWISVYNKYMAFFVRNFGGRPADCFGRRHAVEVSKALVRIQREVILKSPSGSETDEKEGGAIGYLAAELERHYGVRDLPQGYFYFPLSSGGLALHDPLIDILVMGADMITDAAASIERALLLEEEVYDSAKKKWEIEHRETTSVLAQRVPPTVFIPFSSFCEMSSHNLYQLYTGLIGVYKPRPALLTPAISRRKEIKRHGTESYQGWVFEAYGNDVIRRFGGARLCGSEDDPNRIGSFVQNVEDSLGPVRYSCCRSRNTT